MMVTEVAPMDGEVAVHKLAWMKTCGVRTNLLHTAYCAQTWSHRKGERKGQGAIENFIQIRKERHRDDSNNDLARFYIRPRNCLEG